MDLDITDTNWVRERLFVVRKINGARFGLEERISAHYQRKSTAKEIYGAMESFFVTQQVFYEKLKEELGEGALVFGTYMGAKVGKELLEDRTKGEVNYFTNKRVDFSKAYPEPVNTLLGLYLGAMERIRPTPWLEDLTKSFFEWSRDYSLTLIEESYGKVKEIVKEKEIRVLDKKYVVNFSEHKLGRRLEGEKKTKEKIESLLKNIEKGREEEREEKKEKRMSPASCYIAGHEQVKKELGKIIEIVKNQEYFVKLFPLKKLFKNYALVGPPGTGKTTLLMSVAEDEGLYFAPISCVKLGSSFINEPAANVDAVYETAAQIIREKGYKGGIIFFDEFDHWGRKRGSSNSSEDDKVVTTLNNRLDGMGAIPGLVTFIATNKPEIIDEALLSRFKIMYMGYPKDDKGLIAIHQAVIKKVEDYAGRKMVGEIDYGKILDFSKKDERFKSGRAIENIIYDGLVEKARGSLKEGKTFSLLSGEELYRAYQGYDLCGGEIKFQFQEDRLKVLEMV